MNHARTRYLESKRSVDQTALSEVVRTSFVDAVPPNPSIVEVGCGTGVTVPRLFEWGISDAAYKGIDQSQTLIDFAEDVRPRELANQGHSVAETDDGFSIGPFEAQFDRGEVPAALADEQDHDVVMAQAFLDLVSIEQFFTAAVEALTPGGLIYAPITFDGATMFYPSHPADHAVEKGFHRRMGSTDDQAVTAGRESIEVCRRLNGPLRAVRSSDWIVRPDGRGYPRDEAFFLSCILGFIEQSVESLDGPHRLDEWLQTRRRQLDNADLMYVAHQFDILYQREE